MQLPSLEYVRTSSSSRRVVCSGRRGTSGGASGSDSGKVVAVSGSHKCMIHILGPRFECGLQTYLQSERNTGLIVFSKDSNALAQRGGGAVLCIYSHMFW